MSDGGPTSIWHERRGLLLVALATAIAAGAALHPFPSRFVFRYGGDCVRYLTWSRVVVQKGLYAFPLLVEEYRNKWVGFPPPTRWGWLMAVAGLMKLWPNAADEYHPIVLLSWLSGVLMVLPLFFWLRRRAPAPVVMVAMALVVTAPIGRAMGHFPVPDALHACLTIVLFALTAEWLRAPRGALLLGIAFATLVLLSTREIGAINVVGAASMVLLDWRKQGRLRKEPLWALFAGCLAMLLVTLPLAGGPKQLVLLAKDVVHAALFTSGALMYCSGPYYRYLVDFMIVSPVLTVTALCAIAPLRRRPDLRELLDHVLVPTLVVLGLFSLLSKTLRYVMVVDTGMRIIAAMAVWALATRAPAAPGEEAAPAPTTPPLAGSTRGRLLAAALLVALVAHDVAIYRPLWGKDQIYDPVTWGLTKYLKMIPNWGPGPPVE